MALKPLLTRYTLLAQTPDPDNPGVYNESYEVESFVWDTAARERPAPVTRTENYAQGYPGAPAPPSTYSRPIEEPVDAYTVPGPGQPGHVAGKEGQYTTIYHDGQGDVTQTYAPVCDLRVLNVRGVAPGSGQQTGSVEFTASTTAAWLSAALLEQNLGGAPGTPLEQVPPGRLAIQQVPPGTYLLTVEDARGCVVGQNPQLLVTVPLAPPPVVYGCTDEEASNYNPDATQDNGTCTYAPNWQSLWHPDGIAVDVAPAAGEAYVTAELLAGYPAGHPLASVRPLAVLGTVRAAVSPRTGRATLQLAPYLRGQVGALQSDGTRRLDLSSPTALTEDLLVHYRLEVGGRPVARGYAVNSAASAAELQAGATRWPLSPFGLTLPAWPGYAYQVSVLSTDVSGRYGRVEAVTHEADVDSAWVNIHLPCPRNGVPVAWLAPGGGFGYWVFSGHHQHGDDISEGQGYTEALTGEQRLSSRTGSRRTLELYSGVYSKRALVEGLRTLRRAVQAWYQPGGPGTEWLAVTVRGGSFPAYREGRNRYETTIQLTEARPQYVQGQ